MNDEDRTDLREKKKAKKKKRKKERKKKRHELVLHPQHHQLLEVHGRVGEAAQHLSVKLAEEIGSAQLCGCGIGGVARLRETNTDNGHE